MECIAQTISVEDAVATIPHGASLLIGGFMPPVGTPERLIDDIVICRPAGPIDRTIKMPSHGRFHPT